MAVELRDKEMMKMLNSLSYDNQFIDKLNETYSKIENRDNNGFVVHFGSDENAPNFTRFSYFVYFDDIVESWNPDEWNNYPEKQPPYNVPMMVEWEVCTPDDGVRTERLCAEFFKDIEGEYWGISDKFCYGEEATTGREMNIRYKAWK